MRPERCFLLVVICGICPADSDELVQTLHSSRTLSRVSSRQTRKTTTHTIKVERERSPLKGGSKQTPGGSLSVPNKGEKDITSADTFSSSVTRGKGSEQIEAGLRRHTRPPFLEAAASPTQQHTPFCCRTGASLCWIRVYPASARRPSARAAGYRVRGYRPGLACFFLHVVPRWCGERGIAPFFEFARGRHRAPGPSSLALD